MARKSFFESSGLRTAVSLLGLGLMTTLFARSVPAHDSQGTTIARGAGTTIIEGGTGSTGGFIPEHPAGNGSAAFTVNAMYVTGRITGAVVNGDAAKLTGTATITGLGAGTNVPFAIVVHRGGPGATAVLTTGGLVFHEILVEGSIEVQRKEGD
jgi:hypothetical protein